MISRLWFDPAYRRAVRQEVHRLGEWYQPILLPGFIFTRPWTRATIGEWLRAERGGRKCRRFVLPLIGPYLRGATVVELGCNAGHNLVLCLRAGATDAIGIEPDRRYFEQAKLVRQCLGLQRALAVIRDLSLAEQFILGHKEQRIGLLCAVLRHVPEAERVSVLDRMGRLCGRVFINASGLPDAPEGDSLDSILGYVRETTLRIEALYAEPHVRGLRILLRAG